jgi:hypothetical protein
MTKRFTPLKVSAPVRTRPQSSTEEIRREENRFREGPSLTLGSLHREIWQILDGALAGLSDNDYGRQWPRPDGARIGRLIDEFDGDLCRAAAKEAREIVQAQDKAPNITSLFAKKLTELAEVRAIVRRELGA